MTAEAHHWQPQQLEQFLTATLPEEERVSLEQHLEFCDDCRQQLHDSAAEVTWWEDASDFLNDDEFEIVGTTDRGTQPTTIEPHAAMSAESAALPTDIRQVIAWLDPTDDPAMLGRLGVYEIAGVVGAGGMGVVLKGFDRALNRYVAIKILAPHLATSGAARTRFGREAQAAAAVVHNNVIAIHGVDEANGLPYLVMPYLRGISLQRRIDDRGSLSVSEILRLGMQTARGLSAAHDQGLVHRDIKPANILLDGTTERVLLTDFGLARAADDASLTHSGVIAGTPYFMSPEQAEGGAIDHRSDLFSLGSVLYAMCTGRPPFRADTSWGILRKVTDSQPHAVRDLNADIPAWLCEIIRRLHEKNPSDRTQTAHEVAELLEQCLAHVQQPADFSLPESLSLVSEGNANHNFWQAGFAAVAIIVLVCTGMFFWNQFGAKDALPSQSQQTAVTHSESQAALEEEPELAVDTAAASPTNAADSFADIDDESLLDWDDGSLAELASIRAAVEQLDDETLRIIEP